MGVATLLGRRRRVPEEPVAVLLGDPATVQAAADALVHTERADEPAWPLVVTVGRQSVSLHWAGLSAPAPREPWRLGEDPRRWIADRADVAPAAGPDTRRPVVVGRDGDAIVYVNTSRAPGPLTVEAARPAPRPDALAALAELVARQQPQADRGGAWWPVDVAGEAILLLGTPIGTTLPVELMRRAGEAAGVPVRASEPVQTPAPAAVLAAEPMAGSAAEPVAGPAAEPVAGPTGTATPRQPMPEPLSLSEPETDTEPEAEPRDEVFEDWLRQVQMAMAGGVTLGREAEPVRQALPVAAEAVVAAEAEAGVEDTAQIPKIVVDEQDDAVGVVQVAEAVQVADGVVESDTNDDLDDLDEFEDVLDDEDDDLDDWAADFAVSSAVSSSSALSGAASNSGSGSNSGADSGIDDSGPR